MRKSILGYIFSTFFLPIKKKLVHNGGVCKKNLKDFQRFLDEIDIIGEMYKKL